MNNVFQHGENSFKATSNDGCSPSSGYYATAQDEVSKRAFQSTYRHTLSLRMPTCFRRFCFVGDIMTGCCFSLTAERGKVAVRWDSPGDRHLVERLMQTCSTWPAGLEDNHTVWSCHARGFHALVCVTGNDHHWRQTALDPAVWGKLCWPMQRCRFFETRGKRKEQVTAEWKCFWCGPGRRAACLMCQVPLCSFMMQKTQQTHGEQRGATWRVTVSQSLLSFSLSLFKSTHSIPIGRNHSSPWQPAQQAGGALNTFAALLAEGVKTTGSVGEL